MFKKSQRFSFGHGAPKNKIVTPLYIVRFQKTISPTGEPTYAVVSGKIVSKKAVQRNKAKRIFLSALQETLEKNQNKYDLVFFLRRPFMEYQKSAIIQELENSLARIEG